jgi:hypothetical protein
MGALRYSSIILDLGTIWWLVSFTPRPLYLRGNSPRSHLTGGWVGPRAGLDAAQYRKISCTCRESNPTRSQSLRATDSAIPVLKKDKLRLKRIKPHTVANNEFALSLSIVTKVYEVELDRLNKTCGKNTKCSRSLSRITLCIYLQIYIVYLTTL